MPTLNSGFPDIAVGAGAVWASNPDTRSRASTRRPAAAGDLYVEARQDRRRSRGVWSIERPGRLTDRSRSGGVAETIRRARRGAAGIAAAAASVWVSAEQQGVGPRTEPGPAPGDELDRRRPGVTYWPWAGAAWAANSSTAPSPDDPRTNHVTAQIPAPRRRSRPAPASAWASTAGRSREGHAAGIELRRAHLGHPKPHLLIASDLPLQGPAPLHAANADAIRLVLRRTRPQSGQVHGRATATQVHRANRELREPPGARPTRTPTRRQSPRGGHRPLELILRPDRDPDAEIGSRLGCLAMISPTNTYAGLTRSGAPCPSERLQGRTRRVLPDRRPQLRPPPSPGDDLLAVEVAGLSASASACGTGSVQRGRRRPRTSGGNRRRRFPSSTLKKLKPPDRRLGPCFDPAAASYASLANPDRALAGAGVCPLAGARSRAATDC